MLTLGLDRTGHESPDLTGRDTQICQTCPARPDLYFSTFYFQIQVINSHKIRSLDTNLVLKVNKQKKIGIKKIERNSEKKNF